jgi:hypothetical protein
MLYGQEFLLTKAIKKALLALDIGPGEIFVASSYPHVHVNLSSLSAHLEGNKILYNREGAGGSGSSALGSFECRY